MFIGRNLSVTYFLELFIMCIPYLPQTWENARPRDQQSRKCFLLLQKFMPKQWVTPYQFFGLSPKINIPVEILAIIYILDIFTIFIWTCIVNLHTFVAILNLWNMHFLRKFFCPKKWLRKCFIISHVSPSFSLHRKEPDSGSPPVLCSYNQIL